MTDEKILKKIFKDEPPLNIYGSEKEIKTEKIRKITSLSMGVVMIFLVFLLIFLSLMCLVQNYRKIMLKIPSPQVIPIIGHAHLMIGLNTQGVQKRNLNLMKKEFLKSQFNVIKDKKKMNKFKILATHQGLSTAVNISTIRRSLNKRE